MDVVLSYNAQEKMFTVMRDAFKRGTETHAYLLGSRNPDGLRISTVLRAGNPVETPGMTRPDYAASAVAMQPYLRRGEKLLGEAHLHLGHVGPSGIDEHTLLTATPPGYIGLVVAMFADRDPVITAHTAENNHLIAHNVILAPRYESLLPSRTKTTRIALLGCGSLGSLIALQLAKLDPARITLIDGDDLEERNLARHLGEPRDVGKNKAKVLRRITKRRTSSYVCAVPLSMTEKTQARFNHIIDEHDLIINASGHPVASARCSDTCADRKKPCIHAGVFARGAGGFVFLQTPDGPTYQELFQLRLTPFADDKATMETLRHQYGYTEDELSAQLGLWSDVNTVAALTSKVLTDYLKQNTLAHNLYVIDNTSIDIRKVLVAKGEQA